MADTASFTPTPAGFLRFFVRWFNGNVADHDVPPLDEGEAYVVWFCFILGRAKCLLSTTRPDHRYYELTWDPERRMVYADAYVKARNMECAVGSPD